VKIVFLDFDGVLYPIGLPGPPFGAKELGLLAPYVERLNRITSEGDASIVVSTSWRGAWPPIEHIACCTAIRAEMNRLTNVLTAIRCQSCWGCQTASAVELGAILATIGVKASVVGATPCILGPRGGEVLAWLRQHKKDIDSFVILDDAADFPGIKDRLVRTSMTEALLDKHVDAAIALLEQPVDVARWVEAIEVSN
jgi:hypothetical protein